MSGITLLCIAVLLNALNIKRIAQQRLREAHYIDLSIIG